MSGRVCLNICFVGEIVLQGVQGILPYWDPCILALEEPLPLRRVTENPSVAGIFNFRILQLDKHTSVTLILIR